VVADLALGVGAGGVVVRTEVDELGLLVGEQRPDDDQDRAAGRHDRWLPAAATGDPSIALAEEGIGAGGADRGLPEDPGQVAVPVPCAGPALLATGGYVDPRREAGPGDQRSPAAARRTGAASAARRPCAATPHSPVDLGPPRQVLDVAGVEEPGPRQGSGGLDAGLRHGLLHDSDRRRRVVPAGRPQSEASSLLAPGDQRPCPLRARSAGTQRLLGVASGLNDSGLDLRK
jgi:hypothetical protein